MDNGTVSVLTLVKGREGHLRHLLAGLVGGQRWPDRCVIVDMGERPLALPELPFPVTLHRMPQAGLPLAAARNAAAQLAGTPALIFLDVDCIPAPDLVARLAQDVARAAALVCCEVLYLPAQAASAGADPQRLRALGKRHPLRQFPAAGMRQEANAGLFWSLAFASRRSVFERLGGFDEAYVGYGAEAVPLLFTASTVAFHQHHPIYDPPLQHFSDIVANANRFRQRHGIWPMDGWLQAFAAMGLIAPPPAQGALTVLRPPSAAEIAGAAQSATEAYGP
jgi:hypothetical protein